MPHVNAFKARPCRECGLLPLPKGEGWGEGLQTIDRSEPPHPTPLPCGERDSRRAAVKLRAHQQGLRETEPRLVQRQSAPCVFLRPHTARRALTCCLCLPRTSRHHCGAV